MQTQKKTVLQREVEEEDSEMLINSHSYLPLSKLTKERWAKDETDLFYQILRSYGADFTFMAQCFRGRTRKQACSIAEVLHCDKRWNDHFLEYYVIRSLYFVHI
jgi:hypothetical protein